MSSGRPSNLVKLFGEHLSRASCILASTFSPSNLVKLFGELLPLRGSERRDRLEQMNDENRHQLEVLLAADEKAEQGIPPKMEEWTRGTPLAYGYVVDVLLGQGGSGQVYRASVGQVPVALKRVFLTSPLGQSEHRAVELLCDIRPHPHLLCMHRFWVSTPHELVIAMDLADTSLRAVLEERVQDGHSGLEVPQLLKYMQEAAEALDYLHASIHGKEGEKGSVVHRDIKPDNLLLCGGAVKVGDHGLARILQQPGLETVTSVGTFPYAAPEIFEGKVCIHSDQYSLAATYVKLRIGAFHPPPDLSSLCPREIEVIERALHKDPDQRYPSCRAFLRALRESLSDVPTEILAENVTAPRVVNSSLPPRKPIMPDKALQAPLSRRVLIAVVFFVAAVVVPSIWFLMRPVIPSNSLIVEADPKQMGSTTILYDRTDTDYFDQVAIENVEVIYNGNPPKVAQFRVVFKPGMKKGWFQAIHLNKKTKSKYSVKYHVSLHEPLDTEVTRIP